MAAYIARRSTSMRTLWRTTISNTTSSVSSPSIISNLAFRQPRISLPLYPARFRRESLFLSSLLPFHCAIASACLVSKLPNEANTYTDGRFSNYLSPI